MRKLETIAAVLVISLAAVGPARAAVLEHQVLKGKAASLEFLKSTPKTCADGSPGSTDTFVSLFGEESLVTSRVSGRTLINALSATVAVVDSCTGELVSLAIGQVEGGFNSISPKKAILSATIPLTDLFTGAPAGSLNVALTLLGGSIVSFTNSHDRIVFSEDVFRTDQIKGTSRPASATGSLTLNGVPFIGNLVFSLMFDNRDSVTDIQR
jgi:hypothetical protein